MRIFSTFLVFQGGECPLLPPLRTPMLVSRSVYRADVNWGPRSEVMLIGTSKRVIQCLIKALTQMEVLASERGTASGQRV